MSVEENKEVVKRFFGEFASKKMISLTDVRHKERFVNQTNGQKV